MKKEKSEGSYNDQKINRTKDSTNLPDLSLIPVLLLVSSIVYDFSYYWKFGLTFSDIPTTMSDHIRTSIEWLPPLIILIMFSLLIDNAFKRLEKGITKEELIEMSKNKKISKLFHEGWVSLFIIILTILIPLLFILEGDEFFIEYPTFVAPISVFFIWNYIYKWIASYQRFYEYFSAEMRKGFYFIFMTFFIMLSYGYAKAANDLIKQNHSLHLNEGVRLQIRPLRMLERGALTFNNNDSTVHFYPWSEIKKISYADKSQAWIGILEWAKNK